MFSIKNYLNDQFIFILVSILVILAILKFILWKVLNKKELIIGKSICIGKEEIQEDYISIVGESYGTLFVLADGFGKRESGKISSIIATKTISRMFSAEGTSKKLDYFFKKSFNKANIEILKRVETDNGGASALSVVIVDNNLSYALVGNVMLAIFRNNELFKLSEGHSMSDVAKRAYYEGKIDKAEALSALKEKKLIYYLGQPSFKNIEMNEEPIKLEKNDIVVLMSKGIYENIKWVEFERRLKERNKNLQELCTEIVHKIKNNNFKNYNGSIVLVKYCSNKKYNNE